jgi:hypothetical protein
VPPGSRWRATAHKIRRKKLAKLDELPGLRADVPYSRPDGAQEERCSSDWMNTPLIRQGTPSIWWLESHQNCLAVLDIYFFCMKISGCCTVKYD